MPGIISTGKASASLQVRRASNEPTGEYRPGILLRNPYDAHFAGYAARNAKRPNLEMVGPEGSCAGKVLALCGAGPSLRPEVMDPADEVWACNSALPWLIEQGVHVDVGIGIDQTPGMLKDWITAPDATYYIASTTNPELADHLESHGRRVKWFHNFVDFPGELEHYKKDWPVPSSMCGQGANVLTRVIGLAGWLGFRRVDIYGADSALGPNDQVHANGASAVEAYGKPVILQGEVDGRVWRARPDMLMGAVDLARKVQLSSGRIRLIGDTLPVALLDKSPQYLDEVMRRLQPGETPQP